jgi:hypothetical protein
VVHYHLLPQLAVAQAVCKMPMAVTVVQVAVLV